MGPVASPHKVRRVPVCIARRGDPCDRPFLLGAYPKPAIEMLDGSLQLWNPAFRLRPDETLKGKFLEPLAK